MHPYLQALVAGCLLTPAWLAAPFLQRNFGLPPQLFVAAYYAGIAIGTLVWFYGVTQVSGLNSTNITRPLAYAGVFGLTVGVAIHLLLFSAVAHPGINPGIPVAISQIGNVFAFGAAVWLAWWFPHYFDYVEFRASNVIGVLLVTTGVVLLVTSK